MIRVMVIDDSGIYRRLLVKVLQNFSDIEVVGTASDGQEAIEKIAELKPDVVTLDMNMPRMDGMETLAVLAVKYPNIQAIVVASATRDDADRVVSVLEAGAFEMILKPTASDSMPLESLRRELYPKIKAAFTRKNQVGRPLLKPLATEKPELKRNRTARSFAPEIVVIGSSTGGPAALLEVLSHLGSDFPLPIVVVQHMPKLFVETMATRLNRDIRLTCLVAQDETLLEAGNVYLAAGDVHTDIVQVSTGKFMAKFNDAPAEHHCRPSVDVTLRSLHRLRPAVKTLVVVLTGMGSDGAFEAKQLSDLGAKVIAQDEQSSVVWGMPGETVKLGAADEILPLDRIADAMMQYCGSGKGL